MRRIVVAVVAAAFLALGTNAWAAVDPTAVPGPVVTIRNLVVLDGNGHPFPEGTAGVIYCSDGAGCSLGGRADVGGRVEAFELDPRVDYRVFGFATGTGWGCPWTSPTGVQFHFSEALGGRGSSFAAPETFVVSPPHCVEFTILDGNGQPFSQAGIMASPVGGGDMVFGGADASGHVVMTNLDPNVEYDFGAFAVNTGWACGFWTAPDTGDRFWFSGSVSGTPAQVSGTTFVISEPECP